MSAVVGATYPHELEVLRKIMPSSYFLIPGYGAQGGKAEDIALGFDENRLRRNCKQLKRAYVRVQV